MILVISSFFKSSSGCFSFSIIFSFLAKFQVLQGTFLNFLTFSVFLAIFHVLKCVFLIFRYFQFSRHIPHTRARARTHSSPGNEEARMTFLSKNHKIQGWKKSLNRNHERRKASPELFPLSVLP